MKRGLKFLEYTIELYATIGSYNTDNAIHIETPFTNKTPPLLFHKTLHPSMIRSNAVLFYAKFKS